MMEYKRINDVFPDWMTNGIFKALESYNVPWKGTAAAEALDIAYHGGHSGSKIISPLIERFVDSETETLPSGAIEKIANMIYTVCSTNWTKLFATLSFEYNPIENYAMTETETGTGTNSISETGTGTNTQTGTDGVTATVNTTQTADNTGSVYGFNSDKAVNKDAQSGTGESEQKSESTNTKNLTDTETRNFSTSGSTSENRTLKRSGNIGVTTSQQMIESERALWNWYFYDIVFADVDKMLTLSIY